MKKYISLLCLITIFFAIGACKKDSVSSPVYNGQNIDNYDLLQVTNSVTKIPVTFSLPGDNVDSVKIMVYPLGTSIAKSVVKQNLTRVSSSGVNAIIYVDYPSTATAPTGLYTIQVDMYSGGGIKKQQSYNVNIQNNQTQEFCELPPGDLPAGDNVWIKVYTTIPVAASDAVYITGSFETSNGGSDWSGGSSKFKMTRLSNNCFYLPLNMTTANEFKFTNGDWNHEALLNDGATPGNAKWNGKNVQTVIIYNWKGKPVVMQSLLAAAQALPVQGLKFGGMSVIADVNTTSDTAQFYLVKKGASLSDKTYPMYRVSGTSMVIGSVPKDVSASYYVVRNGAKGVSRYGFERTAVWDGKTNPVSIKTPFFLGDAGISTVPSNLFIVGDATVGGWSNPVPIPSQQFTKASDPNVFELTLPLNTSASYLLLPVNGNWSHKFGGKDKVAGDLLTDGDVPGSNTPAPDVSGNYKITVNFSTEKYTVIKQ